MGTKRYNRSSYDNEETPRPDTQDTGQVTSIQDAAEAIRDRKKRQAAELKKLGY